MRYQVTFKKRFNQQGGGADSPQVLLNLPDGVVEESEVVEEIQPDSIHVEEEMDEDDDILPFGSEIWEFQIAEGREDDFVMALKESGVVIEYDLVDDESEAKTEA